MNDKAEGGKSVRKKSRMLTNYRKLLCSTKILTTCKNNLADALKNYVSGNKFITFSFI